MTEKLKEILQKINNDEEALIFVSNIKWDTDREKIDLPSEMTCNLSGIDISDCSTQEEFEIEISEFVSDYISEKTGFCHSGFSLDIDD